MDRTERIIEERRKLLAELPQYDEDDINPELVAMRLKIILAPIPEDDGGDQLALFPKDYFKKDDNGTSDDH